MAATYGPVPFAGTTITLNQECDVATPKRCHECNSGGPCWRYHDDLEPEVSCSNTQAMP